MKYIHRLLLITLSCVVLSSCGGGGSAACSVALGLACSATKSSGGSGGGNGGSSNSPITYRVLHLMGGTVLQEGANPQSTLIEVGGNFYGTTQNGGLWQHGSVFKMDSSGHVTTLCSFRGLTGVDVDGNVDGDAPYAGLLLDKDGSTLYGTTVMGGQYNYGTVFKVIDFANNPTCHIIYTFQGGVNGDGEHPYGVLIQGQTDTDLYGTTTYGGTNGFGTIFRIPLIGNTETYLYNFMNNTDGAYPQSGLIQVGNTLYGTTSEGNNSQGIVFSTDNTLQNVNPLHTFVSGSNEGENPYGQLLFNSQDNMLYGTTINGGDSGLGTVFRLALDGTNYSKQYSFSGTLNTRIDGSRPWGNLVVVNNIIYGTTKEGGNNNGLGSIFKLTPTSSPPAVEAMLYSFGSGNDGASPSAGLVFDSNANIFYGTTANGGNNSQGTIFKFTQ